MWRVFAEHCQNVHKNSQISSQKFSNCTRALLEVPDCSSVLLGRVHGIFRNVGNLHLLKHKRTDRIKTETECSGSEKRQVPSGLSMQPCLSAMWNVPLKIMCISGLNSMFWSVSNMS